MLILLTRPTAPSPCGPHTYACSATSRCVLSSQVCDGTDHCGDMSDEPPGCTRKMLPLYCWCFDTPCFCSLQQNLCRRGRRLVHPVDTTTQRRQVAVHLLLDPCRREQGKSPNHTSGFQNRKICLPCTQWMPWWSPQDHRSKGGFFPSARKRLRKWSVLRDHEQQDQGRQESADKLFQIAFSKTVTRALVGSPR